MSEKFLSNVAKNALAGVGIGLGLGSVGGILMVGMSPDLLPEVKRIIHIPPAPPLIHYGYDPLDCPKDTDVFTDENILLQHGHPVVIGGVQVESNFRKINAITTQSQTFSDEAITIRAGFNGSERTYYVEIGDRVILDDNNPLGNINDPIVYRASVTGYCGYSKPYGPYLSETR